MEENKNAEEERKVKLENKTIAKYAQFSNSIRMILQNLNQLMQYGYPLPLPRDTFALFYECKNS